LSEQRPRPCIFIDLRALVWLWTTTAIRLLFVPVGNDDSVVAGAYTSRAASFIVLKTLKKSPAQRVSG
jgi:hypothetical protein